MTVSHANLSVASTHAGPAHPRHIRHWMQERFPLANGLLFVTLYLATATVARGAAHGGSIAFSLLDVGACVATWSFFLLLRIFDEHKDYELDCHNHPHRVLQSGRITLGYLKAMGVIAVAWQLGVSLWLDHGILGPVTTAWLAMMVWACLMAKEFFIPDWLGRHLTWYAISHMLVMPLIVFWIANLAQPGVALGEHLQTLMLLVFVSGFCFEITRKTKGPEEESPTIETYSRIYGTLGSARIVVALVTTMLALQLWLVYQVLGNLPWWAWLVPSAAYGLALSQLAKFFKAPSASARGKNEAGVAIHMLVGYAVLIGAALSHHGLQRILIIQGV